MQALFSKGYTEAATSQLNAGMNEGLEPNASIYEYIIRTCCENGRKEEARGVLDGMNVRTETLGLQAIHDKATSPIKEW